MRIEYLPADDLLVVKVGRDTVERTVRRLIEVRPEWVDKILADYDQDEDATDELVGQFNDWLMTYAEVVWRRNHPNQALVAVFDNVVDPTEDDPIITEIS